MTLTEDLKKSLGELAETLNLKPDEMTVVRMHPGENGRRKELELLQGSWETKSAWVIIDEKGEPFTVTSAQTLSKMLAMFASAQDETFRLRLEKAIWKRYPIDYYDVWVVAMDKIKQLAKSRPGSTIVKLDLDWLVSEIRQEYPNLFYHLDQLLQQEPE